ncbi:hypothetical protein CVD28_00265 [Bacillus sp. M6-12]|uniref:hypothetical protein n=1 Tax=Bacillus sp. M6-12 TaxID=2054166 RepID=UPI000C770268|nr:hypothetical protein [Bacillus sp. M6-12]PLS18869.1 hypothetical protein CVD28_00265 [Bacillus sp. M6-12]
MTYVEIVKEESNNWFLQYYPEYKNEVLHDKTNFKEHVKELELESDACSLFEYHEVALLKHFGVAYASSEYFDKHDSLIKQFENDLVARLNSLYKEQIQNLFESEEQTIKEHKEDKEYYINREYLQDESMKNETITEEKRQSYIEQYEKQLKQAQEKRDLYKLALDSME